MTLRKECNQCAWSSKVVDFSPSSPPVRIQIVPFGVSGAIRSIAGAQFNLVGEGDATNPAATVLDSNSTLFGSYQFSDVGIRFSSGLWVEPYSGMGGTGHSIIVYRID